MKSFVAVVGLAGLLGSTLFYYSKFQSEQKETAKLRNEMAAARQQIETGDAQASVLKSEIERLQRETSEIHKLRNAVQQLDKQKLELAEEIKKLLVKLPEPTAVDSSNPSTEAERNLAESQKFLEENKSKPGVQMTPSGLQYAVMTEGKGLRPLNTDRVRVHYKGSFVNGEVFDSSYDRRTTTIFPLGGVIKGWAEGLKLMQTGAKYKLFIPPDLAYGTSAPPKIGPNRLLIFEIELLGIEE